MKIILSILSLLIGANLAFGATAATLTLNNVGTTQTQVTAFGDPNAKVELHYGKYASQVTTLGSTDQNGFLTVAISTKSYDIACGNTAFAYVNGQMTTTISWSAPGDSVCSTENTGKFTISEKEIVMTIGQTKSVTLSGSGGYVIKDSTSPVIGTSINGSTLSLYARDFGGSTITVCDSSGSCSIVNVVAMRTIPTIEKQVLYCPVPQATATPVTPAKYTFTLFLTTDSENNEVKELQKRLTNLGFYTGPVTGYFGTKTKEAVIKFQKVKGIDPVGYVGPGTRAVLNK